MILVLQLDEADFGRLHEIDVSEHITLVYRAIDGRLESEPHDWTRPAWGEEAWQRQLTEWRRTLAPDVWLGAFVGGQLVGLASLRYRLSADMAQLTTLHVGRSFRRGGVARDLLLSIIHMASEDGAKSLYVSATRSESAVGFYLSQGFQPAAEPHPDMYKLEPEDIHMIRPLP